MNHETDIFNRHSLLFALVFGLVLPFGVGTAVAQQSEELAQSDTEYADAGTPAEEYAFEWGGVYELSAGVTELVLQPGPDASIDIALVPVAEDSGAAFDTAVAKAVRVFEGQPKPIEPGEEIAPGSQFLQLRVDGGGEMRFMVRVPKDGRYALFTQHFADEFQTIFVADGRKILPQSSRNFVDRFGQIVIMPTAVKAFGVRVEPVARQILIPSFTAPARVAYDTERMAHISSAVVGRVASLPVRQGDLVKAGDIVLVVDSPELGEAQNEYLQKKILAHSAAPIVELTKSVYERAQKIYDESQGISLTEVQRRQVELQDAESILINARGAMTGAKNQLQLLGMSEDEINILGESGIITPKYIVRASIAGRVIRRDITLGELVGPDRDSLLVLADMSNLWVLVDVPEMEIQNVVVGATARITFAAFSGNAFDGVVSFINSELNAATRTVQVRVEVNNANGLLRPGMFAKAEIYDIPDMAENGNGAGLIVVPESAIQTIKGKPVVFVPFTEKPNTFLKRPVTLGSEVGGMVPVLYGLREGEPIVVAASFILKAQLGKSTAKHAH